jgi:hypothetical protein
MGNYILDLMIDNYRLQSLQRICRGYKPQVPVDFVIQELAFDDKTIGLEFLKKAGCIIILENGMREINTKDTVVDFTSLSSENLLL